MPPSDVTRERIFAAILRYNQAAKLDGQPDDLNPSMLDEARVAALVEGLPKLPEPILKRLEGRSLVLGAEGLLLSTSSPVRATDIEAGYTISLPEEDETVVLASLQTTLDREKAEAHATRAEEAARAADAEIANLEKSGPSSASRNAKQRRFASGRVWVITAKAISNAFPKDRAAKKRATEATKAASKWATPSWIGMPR